MPQLILTLNYFIPPNTTPTMEWATPRHVCQHQHTRPVYLVCKPDLCSSIWGTSSTAGATSVEEGKRYGLCPSSPPNTRQIPEMLLTLIRLACSKYVLPSTILFLPLCLLACQQLRRLMHFFSTWAKMADYPCCRQSWPLIHWNQSKKNSNKLKRHHVRKQNYC